MAIATKEKINTKIEKSFPMPKPTTWPTSLEARHIVPLADKMGDELGAAVFETSVRALENAENAVNEITKAEHAVQVEQLALEKSGQANQRLVQKDGKIYAVGGKFGELAQLSDKVLGKEQERFDAAVRRVAAHQANMVKLMDAKLVCKDTQADAPLRSDLRNWLKALGPNKAKYEAVKAATEGNLSVIHTVLTAPTQLTGLTQADLDTVRTEARKKLAPDLFQSHQQSEAILATMINASKAINQKRASVDIYRLKDESDANAALGKLGSMARA